MVTRREECILTSASFQIEKETLTLEFFLETHSPVNRWEVVLSKRDARKLKEILNRVYIPAD